MCNFICDILNYTTDLMEKFYGFLCFCCALFIFLVFGIISSLFLADLLCRGSLVCSTFPSISVFSYLKMFSKFDQNIYQKIKEANIYSLRVGVECIAGD